MPINQNFLKMHGLGNDFVMLDWRGDKTSLSDFQVKKIADRKTGVGCDQLIVMRTSEEADVFMEIRNADGSEVAACGNATRCVGRFMMDETHRDSVIIETKAGFLKAREAGNGLVEVDMGPPRLRSEDIPLADSCDTLHLPVKEGGYSDPVGVSMGNPHMVFFVEDAEAVPLVEIGPLLENHALFPEKTNVEFVSLLPSGALRMRVWERGTGITRACGTGACAAVVAAVRRGLISEGAEVVLDGGSLSIHWNGPGGSVLMTGAAERSFEGRLLCL